MDSRREIWFPKLLFFLLVYLTVLVVAFTSKEVQSHPLFPAIAVAKPRTSPWTHQRGGAVRLTALTPIQREGGWKTSQQGLLTWSEGLDWAGLEGAF